MLALLSSLSLVSLIHTYWLNPQKEILPVPAHSRKISSRLEAEWLRSFNKHLPLPLALKRSEIKDARGESLEVKIRKTSNTLLSLDEVEATDDGLDLVSHSLPYTGMKRDLEEIIALRWTANPDAMPLEAEAFSQSEFFLSRLPLSLQDKLKSTQGSEVEISEAKFKSQFGSEMARIFISGEEQNFPLKLKPGRCLLQILRGAVIETHWFDPSELRSNLLWKKTIFKMIDPQLATTALNLSRPQDLPPDDVQVLVKDGTTPETFHFAAPKPVIRQARLSLSALPSPTAPLQNLALAKNTDLMSSEIQAEHRKSLFESPWFWVISVAAAVGTGFLVYEVTKSGESTVKTP